ncbi:MAG: hypothetical protein QN187_04645 [Armatimonadota bacterium]|nr:hypothetical protein [Armatimonadota bacterium]MDR7518159.1 hypothetical protein [Armatimonadota bacterium]MDR7521276.1 hypothetical protein [Armatimonadota bacterium]MDR7550576.1 hypothetical protein [Armatimonadota bacterium]
MATRRRLRPFRALAEAEDRFWEAVEQAVPSDVRDHLAAARRELLLAVRSTVDRALDRLEGAPSPRRPRRVRVK